MHDNHNAGSVKTMVGGVMDDRRYFERLSQ
jgi:hypothetical protein